MKEDPRQSNISSFPLSALGIVMAKDSETATPARWGSGVLIMRDVVLTAAHNVYHEEKPTRRRFPDITFISAVNYTEAPFQEIEVEYVFALDSYTNYKDQLDAETRVRGNMLS